jgi:hypothetical protein
MSYSFPFFFYRDDWIVYGYGTGWTFHINICNAVLYRNETDKYSTFLDIGVYGINPEYFGRNSATQTDHSLG